jgi:hypothetical protein
MRNDLLVGVLILLLVLELCRLCRQANIQKLLFHQARTLPAKTPRQLNPRASRIARIARPTSP